LLLHDFFDEFLLCEDFINILVKLALSQLVEHAENIQISVPVKDQRRHSQGENINKRQEDILHVEILPQESDSLDVQRIDMLP
jgi:hypothetical protein